MYHMTRDSVVAHAVTQAADSSAMPDVLLSLLVLIIVVAVVLHWLNQQGKVPLRDD